VVVEQHGAERRQLGVSVIKLSFRRKKMKVTHRKVFFVLYKIFESEVRSLPRSLEILLVSLVFYPKS